MCFCSWDGLLGSGGLLEEGWLEGDDLRARAEHDFLGFFRFIWDNREPLFPRFSVFWSLECLLEALFKRLEKA